MRTLEVVRATSSSSATNLHFSQQQQQHEVIAYSYRFAEDDVYREDPVPVPVNSGWYNYNSSQQGARFTSANPPNSQSSSPVYTNTTGSSPEAVAAEHVDYVNYLPNSPVSPPPLPPPLTTILRQRSRNGSGGDYQPKPSKSVHWVSDRKKRAADISGDRKMVKYQVERQKKEINESKIKRVLILPRPRWEQSCF